MTLLENPNSNITSGVPPVEVWSTYGTSNNGEVKDAEIPKGHTATPEQTALNGLAKTTKGPTLLPGDMTPTEEMSAEAYAEQKAEEAADAPTSYPRLPRPTRKNYSPPTPMPKADIATSRGLPLTAEEERARKNGYGGHSSPR